MHRALRQRSSANYNERARYMNRRDALVAGLLSAGLVALLVPFARLGVDMHHDGIMLKPALDVLAGQVLFRDTFMQYGALTCYLQVLALWIHPSLLSVKLLTVAAYGATLFFLYASWRLILPRALTILSCGLFILFIPGYEKSWLDEYWILLPWSSVFAMMFQSIGLYALFRVIRAEGPERWGLVLGMACACVFWCRQPVGIIMVGCVAVIWPALHWTNWAPANHSKRSILVRIIGGFTLVNALLLGGILVSGALAEWWYQNFIWPFKMAGRGNVSWDASLTGFVHPVAGAWLLVVLLAAATPGLMRRFRSALSPRGIGVYYVCIGGLGLWQYERVLQALALREGGWTVLFPLVVLLQASISVTRAVVTRGSPKTTEYYLIAAWAAWSLGSLLQYFPLADSWHILWALAPTFGLFVFLFWQWMDRRAFVVALVLTLAFLPSLWMKTQATVGALAQPRVTLSRPAVLRGMRVLPEQAHRIGRIMDIMESILRTQPDIPAALIGDDAMYLCFTPNHANPSPYFVTWKGLADQADNQRRWDYILRVRPLMFLLRTRQEAVDDFYRRDRYVPLLSVPEEALEIAVPEELAKTMGRTASGAPAKEPFKP